MEHKAIRGASVRSTLECGTSYTGSDLSTSPRFPVELGAVPAIHPDAEIRPGQTAEDYEEKPFHAKQHTPVFF
jgi:hypothetical protein